MITREITAPRYASSEIWKIRKIAAATSVDAEMIESSAASFPELIRESELTAKEIYDSIEKLAIVEVNLQINDDLEAVQTIFEKINSTGKPLSAADLIRNFLLISNSSFEQEKLYNDIG